MSGAHVNVSQTYKITLYGGVTLGELTNELLAIDWPTDSRVSFDVFKGDQRDGTSTTITITPPTRKLAGS